jgi:hypothetical protein
MTRVRFPHPAPNNNKMFNIKLPVETLNDLISLLNDKSKPRRLVSAELAPCTIADTKILIKYEVFHEQTNEWISMSVSFPLREATVE